MKLIILYYIVVNAVAFFMYGADKYFAQNGMWRISEKALIGVAAIGGCFGAFAGMDIFRHKTKHTSFKIVIPVCCLVHIWLIVLAVT